MKSWLGLIVALVAVCAAGCGSGGGDPPDGPDAGACPGALSFAWPSEADPQVCARPLDPGRPAERTQCGEILEDCDTTGRSEPNLDCLTSPPAPEPPGTITLTGYADVFSSGPSSNNARIDVYRASDVPDTVTDLEDVTPVGSAVLALDSTTVATARACPRERTEPEALHGDCVIPDTDCTGCDVADDAVDFCYQTQCYALQRWEVVYTIPDVPTNTPLVIRTIGAAAGTPDPQHSTWAPVVQYNVYLSSLDRACDLDPYKLDENCLDDSGAEPVYRLNANLLSRSDYETIPVTAGLSGGVQTGHGAVAGEVHDCDDVRIEFAQVGYDRVPLKPIYFNDNPVRTLPDLSRSAVGTSALSLYSGLDLEPGPVHVAALGIVGGVPTLIGEFRARVWPDAVTIIGINGGKPPQE
jgi:hypothetical protein